LLIDNPAWIDTVVDWQRAYVDDDDRVRLAISLARENVMRETGGPFGAAVFQAATGRLVAVGVNSVVRLRNSALHGEMIALMLAQHRVESFTLAARGGPGHELVSSCDPCAMCLGALLWSGVGRVVASAARDDAMDLGFDEGPVFPESYRYLEERGIEIVRGTLRQEARAVLELYRSRGGQIYGG
jgi:tRNA(Arg) A34 adenosine deaminase TadA